MVMRNILFTGALLCTMITSAQNWNLINSKESYHYTIDGDTLNSIIYTVETDSVAVENGDSVFYLNRRIRPYNEYSYDVYVMGPVFDLLGTRVIQRADTFLCIHQDTNIFIPTANINDSWVFNASKNQVAVVDTIYSSIVLGEEDSLKVISVFGIDTTEFIISKNVGMYCFNEPGKKLYVFEYGDESLRFDRNFSGTREMIIVGLSYKKKGVYPAYFYEYFNKLSVDDFFVYHYNQISGFDEDGYHLKKEVTGFEDGVDSLKLNYATYKKNYFYTYDPNFPAVFYPTEKIFSSNIIYQNWDEYYSKNKYHEDNAKTGELVDFPADRIFLDRFYDEDFDGLFITANNRMKDGKYEKILSTSTEFEIPPLYMSDTNPFYYNVWGSSPGNLIPDLYLEINRIGIGLVYGSYAYGSTYLVSYDIIGYSINGIESGIISSFNEKEMNHCDKTNKYFQVQSDNLSKTIKIISPSGNSRPDNLKLQISDISGRTLYSGRLTSSEMTVNISDISSGIYVLKIIGNDFSESHKLNIGF